MKTSSYLLAASIVSALALSALDLHGPIRIVSYFITLAVFCAGVYLLNDNR